MTVESWIIGLTQRFPETPGPSDCTLSLNNAKCIKVVMPCIFCKALFWPQQVNGFSPLALTKIVSMYR